MHQPNFESFQAVADRKWLERLYYYHGFYCANHPLQIIFICGVLIFVCSAPIISFSPLTAKSPSEWNETIPVTNVTVLSSEKPDWVKEKPVAYIQQIAVAVLVEPINSSLVPYVVQEAFQPVFKIVKDLHEHKHQAMNYEKSIKLTDLCFVIDHRDPFLFTDGGKVLPRKGCLQISPANLWHDVASFDKDMDIMAKIYGTPSKSIVSLKENMFGVPLRAIGLFPLNVTKDCLVIRYAITAVLHQYNPSFITSLRNLLQDKYPSIVTPEDDIDQIVHIHYEGDNIIEIYHLCFTYVMVFVYVAFSVSKIEMVKSKLGLAISAVVTVVASLSMAAGLCIFFGMVPSVSSSEIFPYLVIIIGLENILVITRSIVSTPAYLPVPLRVAEGLSREGGSITLNLTTELLLLLCGYLTFVPAVQEFCMVGGVGVLTDFFLQIVFFSTVLSIDLSRLEPQVQYQKSPQVEIDVDSTLLLSSPCEAKKKKAEIKKSSTWRDLFLSVTRKTFTIRQDLPKRLNFAYFWARTRIVQRGCMICAILYLVYVSSSTLLAKDDELLPNTGQQITELNNETSNNNMTTTDIFPDKAKSDFTVYGKSPLGNLDSKCTDNMKSGGLWRNLSRLHWPELLDLYGVNVMDRHISVLPPINVQFKVNTLHFINSVSSASDSVSEFYQDYSKDSRWSVSSYAVKFELVDFVKVLYILTGIFITVAMYLVYVMFTALPSRRRRKHKGSKKTIVPAAYPVFLDGHEQKIECIDCNENVIASSCLQGTVRVWDCQTSECISVIERRRRTPQIWCVKYWDNFVAVGCSNGDVEIWNVSSERMEFLYESSSCGITSVLFIPDSNILIISRLNGVLEFLELGNRLLESNVESSTTTSKNNHLPLKVHCNNISSWPVITNSVLRDLYPCYSFRAHRKTISVLATSNDLLITGSYDNLLKVFRSHSGLCLFTLRGHNSPVTALCIDEPDQGAVSGSFDGELLLWSLISGECSRFSTGHLTSIITIVSSGDRIISLDISELLCIWDRSSRTCLQNIPQLPGGCQDLTLMSTNIAVCVGKDSLIMLDLASAQILRLVELDYKDDHVMMTRVVKSGNNAVVCDYGKRLVLFTFLEITEKLE